MIIGSGGLILSKKLRTKIITGTRAYNAANGDVSYSGVGFKPDFLIAIHQNDSAVGGGWSISDENLAAFTASVGVGAGWQHGDYFLYGYSAGALYSVIKSLDADGFTLTWTTASAAATVMHFAVLCIKLE